MTFLVECERPLTPRAFSGILPSVSCVGRLLLPLAFSVFTFLTKWNSTKISPVDCSAFLTEFPILRPQSSAMRKASASYYKMEGSFPTYGQLREKELAHIPSSIHEEFGTFLKVPFIVEQFQVAANRSSHVNSI